MLGAGTCSYIYVQYNMRVNEWKTNTDSCVLYLSVHYSAWSVEQHEVKPSGHSIVYQNNQKTVDHSYVYTISPAYTNKVINQYSEF